MTAALKVVAPGLHTTVQDLGRFGYQEFGVLYQLCVVGGEPASAGPSARLLVGCSQEDDVALQRRSRPFQQQKGHKLGRAEALHIQGAASVEVSVLLDEFEGVH